MESELRKIVDDHQTNINNQRQEIEHNLERLKTGAKDKELELRKHNIDQEHEQILEGIRQDFHQKLKELTINYVNTIKETQERCKNEMDAIHKSFELLRRKRKMEHDKEILRIQDKCRSDISNAERCKDDEVKQT